MKKRCAILWLRNDLRLHDHEALNLLAETMDQLLPVYCFDPRDFENQPLGFPRIGALRARFLVESLEDLRAALRARGSDLHVALGAPELVIARLARDCGAAVVFTERQMLGPAVEVERRLAAVEYAVFRQKSSPVRVDRRNTAPDGCNNRPCSPARAGADARTGQIAEVRPGAAQSGRAPDHSRRRYAG